MTGNEKGEGFCLKSGGELLFSHLLRDWSKI